LTFEKRLMCFFNGAGVAHNLFLFIKMMSFEIFFNYKIKTISFYYFIKIKLF